MKILKHGILYDNDPLRSKCICGCEVEVIAKELQKGTEKKFDIRNESSDEIVFYVICPECGNKIIFKDKSLDDLKRYYNG